jgi:hypothetical protein
MTVTINASTSSGVVITPDYSGNIQLQYNGVAAPAFFVYPATATALTNGAWTKIKFDTEIFDTNNNFDTSNYRFTPTIAGYYLINGSSSLNTNASGSSNHAFSIWKNGNEYVRGGPGAAPAGYIYSQVSALIYFNGSTDYVELYEYQNSGNSVNVQTGSLVNPTVVFNGILLRGA